MPDNVDKLFEIMQANGAANDRNKFRKVFLTPGNKGYKIRKDIYDGLRADGIIDSPTYEDFRRKLRLGGTPTVNKYRQQMFNSVDPNKNGLNALSHRAVSQAKRAMNNVRKPVTAKVVDKKGKPTGEEFAITPAKTVEDLDREYAQETTKNWENELHDQMADADKDAAKISDMFKSFIGSTDEVGSVWGNMTRGGGIAGTPHSVTTNNGILENTEARQLLAAGDYNRKRKELLQLEQDSRNGATFDNHSFFRGMYDAAKDTGFLTGGASDLINAGSLLATKQDLDNGIHTEAGDMLMQQAVKNSDAQSQYGDNQGWMYTGGVITTNMAPFMVQIGSAGFSKGMSNAIGKVVQGAASKVALGTMEKATGMAGAHIANYIGKVTGLTTKAFGKAIQYGIVGAAQANTVGLGNVANDVINRYTGQVYQDEQGKYKFGTFDSDGNLVHEGGEDFLTALVKGEAAQTIEFATELAGSGIDAAGTALKNFVTKGGKKIINKYNMENVSKVINFLLNNKVAKNARYLKAGADRTLGKVELNSIVGESLEEELGIIANTVFTGDNKISDLWDEKQQSQIWGGMLLSIGLMKGAVAPFHAYNAKQYYSYKHKLNKADVNLSQLLGKEKWEELRNQIDATTNDDMPEMVNKINRDVALGKNRQPVREYIQNLLIMRGYDIGNMLAAKKAVEDKGEGVSVKNMEKNQAYQQGRDAYGYDTHEIQLDQEDKQKSLAQLLGISEQQLASMSDEELESFSGRDDNIDRAIYDYQLSSARYEGVVDNARDQIDLEVQRAAQAVDMYTDKSRNTIRNATIKASGGLEDYGVYIISGNIATHDDGSIDVSNSDDMILYYDPTTNTVEHADAMMFAELGSDENADEVRSQAMADAKEKAIKETTGIIDGVVEVGTQFKTVDADGTEHTYEVLADNGDGTAMITIDGNIPTELVKGENVQVPVSFEELQKMKDESDHKRLQAAKAQREQVEKERAAQQTQETEQTQPSFDFNQILNDDGNVVLADVLEKDGNTKYPNSKLFLIRDSGAKAKVMELKSDGSFVPHAVNKEDVAIISSMSLDEYKQAFVASSMIEDNSGENRGEIEVESPTTIEDETTPEVAENTETTAPADETTETPTTEQTPAITLEDGTIVPMLEDGNPDFSKLTAAQTAELYDNQFGEDADSIVSGYVSDAKKALDKANNMTVKGKTFVEQKASKDAKEKAIADAQAAYDSAIAIRDAYNERQLAKVEDTAEGRKNLIEKARRKFARLKSAVKDDAEAVAQIYKETVGSLLHRLYDGTGIDVTDTIPLTAEEYVASNLGAHSLNYEGTETSKSVKQETGLSREDFAKTQLLAADGKGTTIDNLVHSLWENRPSNLDTLGTQDIRNALIDVLTSGFKASEARSYVENIRIAQAEKLIEEEKTAAENAAYYEQQKAKEEEEKKKAELEKKAEEEKKKAEENIDLPAIDKQGEPINNNIIELAKWAKKQGLEIDPTSKLNSYADLFLMCKDGFGVSTLVPDEGKNINQVIYFPDNAEVVEQLGKLQEEFNAGRDLNHSSNIDSEITEGATFYDAATAKEFRDFVNEQTKFPDKLREGSNAIEVPEDATDENPLGLQLSEDKVPFEIEGGKSGETYNINDDEDRQRLINDNKVDDKDILDIDMPKHVHKAIKELCKKMGLKVQFLYMGARSNGWMENGTMYLALDTEKATQFVFGHEMTHAIKQKNPEAYKELVKVAMAVTTRKKFEEDLAKVYQNYHGISGYNNVDDYVEEVVADNLGKFINDFDLAQKFSLRLNHPVLATILHAIQKTKSLLYGDFYKSVDALERIVEKAYVDTAKGEVTNSETGENVSFSLRQKPEPKKKGVGYKVFVLKDGKLYPPMVANPDGAATPVGVWLDADAAPIAGESKTGRPQVKQGGKGTQGGSGKLAYRPGWHLGVVPYAIQFNRKDAEGNKTLFPKNFVFAEVEYAADVDYQEEARQEGINPSGKYQHSLAGLKHLPTDGFYMYRTNPNPETDPWVITGAMKVNRILTRAEQAELVKNAGREPQQIQEGDIVTDDVVNSINQEIADAPKFSIKTYHGSQASFDHFDHSFMGSGEGAQAYGWGTYVSEVEGIAKAYAKQNNRRHQNKEVEYLYDGKLISSYENNSLYQRIFNLMEKDGMTAQNAINYDLYRAKQDLKKAEMEVKENPQTSWFNNIAIEVNKSDIEQLQKLDANKFKIAKIDISRNLYSVDIPDDTGDNYIGWDEPLTEKMYDAEIKILESVGYKVNSMNEYGTLLDNTKNGGTLMIPSRENQTGGSFYKDMAEKLGSQKAASLALKNLGFVGVKVIADRTTGGNKEGKMNYVIFDENNAQITNHTKFSLRLKSAIEETETNPSDAQKESGNYKKGHIKFGGYDYTIENPKGSTRSGKDANGKEWKVTMHDTYGYIRGKFGKDGDHLDMFINDKADLDNWDGDVFVVDQVNPDGSFDEHKVMYGYDSMDDAEKAYLANYSKGWQGLGNITGASKDEFDKWLDTSNRKLKPFADYAKVKFSQAQSVSEPRYSLKDIKPIGVGAFGNIYNQFRGKSKAAIEFLKKLGSGEATAALHHHTIGDISLVWGDKKTGLDKILRKHPEVVDNLQSIIDSMEVVQESDNRIKLESPTHFAVVSKEYKGEPREQWLLTAYEKRESLENDKSMDTATSSLGGDTALSQSKGSAAKIDNSSETSKENGEKFSLKDEKTMFGMHNISLDKLRKAIKQGGFAAPSMGVIDSKNGIYSGYGEITLIPKAEKIAKRTGKNIGTYSADAWTPIYPPVEKKFGGNGGDVAYDDIESVPKEMQRLTRNAINSFMDGREANGLAYLYLQEKGKAPELVHVEGKYPKELHDEVKGILGKLNGIYNTTDEQKEKLLDLFIREVYDGNKEEFDNDIKKFIKKDEEFIKKRPNSNIAKNKQLDVDWMKEHGYDYGALSRFVDGILRDAETSGKVDENATMKAAQQYIQDKGMKEDFDSWKEKLNDRYNVEEVIFAGYKPDGNRKYLPNTVENAVKVMKQDGKNASVGSASFSHFVASILKPMGTLDQIRKKKGNLTGNYEDVEKFQEKWQSVYDELADKMQPDAEPFESYGMDRLEEVATQKNPKKYAKEEYGVDLTDEDINKLNELIEAVKNDKPSIYFETKFMRPYGFDEFEKAIVPNDTPSDVVDALKMAGIDVSSYERGNAKDRQKVTMDAINSSDNIRFSLKTMIEKPEGWKQANKKAIHIAEAIERDPKFSLKNLDGTLIKAGTYFSGGGLVEEGLKGIIDPVVAVEYDEKISGVYRNNFGQHIVTADVRDVDPKELVKQIDGEVEYFHASPVCKNYSQAKSNHAEVELDKETAASTAEFINAVKPKVVTIENVKGYKDSEAMKIITDALDANGYTWDADVYNAADYGGYTNRERLIVRAVRDGKLPEKPKKMARKSGWYEAVADIIPTLTEKKNGVAPWMDIRLKADGIDWRNIDKPLYVMGSAYADGKIPHAFADELLPTLRTKSGDVIVMPDGKVYRAMGRVLARVSGVSDDYKMPFSENLSHTIIGNGIPTQLTEHVIAPLLQNTLRPTTPDDGNSKFSLRYDKFEHDLNQWKKDNNLPKDAQRPTIPQRNAGESAVDFLRRVDEYRKQMALWKTAPTYEQHLLSNDTALGEFNRELQRGSVLKRIAFQDSMLAIRKAQEAIMKEVGVDRLNMAEDAYTAENRSHGKGKNEFEEYNNEFLQPLRKAYHQMKKILGDSYDNVRIYMMAKHGLERDAQMAFKKSLEADYEDVAQRSAAYKAYKGDMNRIINDSDLEFGRINFTTWRQRDNALRVKYSPSFMNYRYDKMGIAYDYSGLSALFDGSDFEEAAYKLVKDIEDKYVTETHDLWDATNAATKKILRDGYKAGMMSKDTYQYVRDMYSHYIPLRGWDGTTADQVWDYIGGGKGAFNQTLKKAHGRTSIADDPIAYIENMAESGILLNNKNWVKQHLMLLAQNHPTSLLTLSKAWYVKSTDANGNEEWIPATPQITSQMNSNQVKAAIDAFEQKMDQMAQTGDATQKRDGLNIAYPQTHSEEREHEVRVMKDGEEYVIYVNGDPQLAQAMNNTRAHRVSEGIKNSISKRVIAVVGRKMAAAYTSLSPLFIPSNYFRDLTMTLASTAIREDGRYNYLLRKNLAISWNLGFMLKDYQNGKLREKVSNGNATPKEQMFYDFMMNGGETGFVSSFDVEDLKKKFKNDLKDLDRWKANPVKVGHTIMDGIEFLNRMIEDSNRFAIYMTSIQYGRSIDEAVNDAKDVTLNFNRKGTGEHSWQTIRNLYLFINPAVQSLQTLGALAKHHPFKFTAVTASWIASGVLVPIVNVALMQMAAAFLGGDGDDDKDLYKDISKKYWQFTKWDRRNNLIMWFPFTHEFIKIPLAQEFRAFYGLGDMIASKMMGGELAEESWEDYGWDLVGQVVDMLPLDPTGYDGELGVSLMPNPIRPVFELAFNVDFTGKPIFKDTEYNKYDPNFTKAYVGTPDWLVRASKMVNSIGNDYPDVQQNSIDAFGDPKYNLNNPAVVDHVLSSYLGGAYTMGSQVLGVLTKSLNDPKEIKVADIPLVSKFVSNPDDRPVTKKQGDEFWNMKENHDRAANTLSKLKKQAKVDGDYSMLERFYGSEEYKQYKQDDVKVKKYEEDKKKERAEESGEEYRPHKLNAEDIYKAHATPKDDFEDLKLKQLYTKLNGFKTSYDLLVDTAPSQSDAYYNTNKAAIDAIDEISLDKQEISELKKGFLDDGKDAYNAEDMKQIRELRKKILAVLEKANKVVVANQKANAKKK